MSRRRWLTRFEPEQWWEGEIESTEDIEKAWDRWCIAKRDFLVTWGAVEEYTGPSWSEKCELADALLRYEKRLQVNG